MTGKRSLWKRIIRAIFLVHLWFWGSVSLLCLLYNFINPPITPLIIQRYLFRGHDLKKREFISLEKIPKQVISYTLALEDPNFYKHMGFEWEMIRRARQHNKKAGKIRFGASTISNQVARTIFLTTHRNYFRKYLEVQVTIIMEVLLSKDRMLELYLNYVEWGKGIYGIESATRHYYGKSARNLNREQSMRMVSILSNPIKYTPFTYQNSRSARIRYENLRKAFIASGG